MNRCAVELLNVRRTGLVAVIGVVIVVGHLGLSAGSARASLDLIKGRPDLTSSVVFVNYDYDPSTETGTFTADGTPAAIVLTSGGSSVPVTGGAFHVEVKFDKNGIPIGGVNDVLDIDGTVGSTYSGDLLDGTLSEFGSYNGASPAGDRFEFVFDVTGGGLSGAYGPKAGVILVPGTWSTFNGKFDEDFHNKLNGLMTFGDGTADTFVPIPEPGSMLIWLLAITFCVGLPLCRSRMTRRRAQSGFRQPLPHRVANCRAESDRCSRSDSVGPA